MDRKTKSKPVTFRLTAQEYEGLKQAAKDNGLSVSQYVTQHVLAGKGLTLDQIRTIYHQLLKIKDFARMEPQSKFASEIQAECDVIWQCLK